MFLTKEILPGIQAMRHSVPHSVSTQTQRVSWGERSHLIRSWRPEIQPNPSGPEKSCRGASTHQNSRPASPFPGHLQLPSCTQTNPKNPRAFFPGTVLLLTHSSNLFMFFSHPEMPSPPLPSLIRPSKPRCDLSLLRVHRVNLWFSVYPS